jgi:hypothetical protein
MFWLAAAAAIAAYTPVPQAASAGWRATASVQARATVRILSGVRLKLDSPTNPGAPAAHNSMFVASDGSRQPAKLIEFE